MAFYFLYFLPSDSLPLLIFLLLFTDYEQKEGFWA